MTFTISHSRSDRLDHLFDILKTSYRNFLNHYGTKRILGHVDGTVRSFEVTRKNNGWHPHFHCLFFLSLDFSFSDESICELKKIWSSSVKRAGGKADPDIGLRVQRGDNAASYICKLGSELQGQECKNSRDFLQLLVNRQKSLVQEYLTALKGVNWLKWSRDLRSRLSLSDITDNQIVEGVPFFNKRKLPVSQLMLNFLEDVFFQHDLDGKGRDTLVDFLNSKSNRMF